MDSPNKQYVDGELCFVDMDYKSFKAHSDPVDKGPTWEKLISEPRLVGSPKILSESLLVEPPKILSEPPWSPFAMEQIEGHLSALRSLVKEHNTRGKEIVDADLKRPFKEANWLNRTLTKYRRLDEMMTKLDDFVRSEEAFTSTGLPKGEASEAFKKSTGPINRREYRFYRAGYRVNRRRNEGRNAFNSRDVLSQL
ncbi:hypothetical protein Tco_0883433 [Tanacetum coccineum]